MNNLKLIIDGQVNTQAILFYIQIGLTPSHRTCHGTKEASKLDNPATQPTIRHEASPRSPPAINSTRNSLPYTPITPTTPPKHTSHIHIHIPKRQAVETSQHRRRPPRIRHTMVPHQLRGRRRIRPPSHGTRSHQGLSLRHC